MPGLDDLLNDPLDPWQQYLARRRQQDVEGQARGRAAIAAPYNSAEEKDSALQDVLGRGATGLQWVGETLGKAFGGRAIRAGLSGLSGGDFSPRELLSVLPGSDTLGLTDPSQAVSGEQLAKQWGLLEGDGQKGEFEARDLVGPGLEAALDPGTYLTFGAGALTSAGKGAAKLGALPKGLSARIGGHTGEAAIAKLMGMPLADAQAAAGKVGQTLADLVGKPLAGVAGLRLPFGEATDATIFGASPAGRALVDRLSNSLPGRAASYVANSKLGRAAAAAFNPVYEGQTHPEVQRALAEAEPAAKHTAAEFARSLAGAADPLIPLSKEGRLPADYARIVRGLAEGVPTSPGPYAPDVLDALGQAAQGLQAHHAAELPAVQAAGVKLKPWESVFGTKLTHRAPTPTEVGEKVAGGAPREQWTRALYAGASPAQARQRALDVKGGTNEVNRMLRDPRLGPEPVLPSGAPLPKLNEAQQQALQARIRQGFDNFPLADHQELLSLRASARAGPLAGADAARLAQLETAYRTSNRQVRRAIAQDYLGLDPAELRRLRRAAKAGTLGPADAERLAELELLGGESRAMTARTYKARAGRLADQFADPAANIMPELDTTFRSRLVENTLRKEYLPVDQVRLTDLATRAGLDGPALRELLAAPGPQRSSILSSLPLAPAEAEELLHLAQTDWQAKPLAGMFARLDKARFGPEGVGLFGNDPFMDAWRSSRQFSKAMRNAGVAVDVAGGAAAYGRDAAGEGSVALKAVADRLRLSDEARDQILQRVSASGALPGAKAGDFAKLRVDPETASALLALVPKAQVPAYLKEPLRWFDDLTNLTRAGLTLPWPAFHTRNYASSGIQSMMAGGGGALGEGEGLARAVRGGGAPAALMDIPFARASGAATPEEAASLLGREAFATRAYGMGIGHMPETADQLRTLEQSLLPAIPGAVPKYGLGGLLSGEAIPKDATWNPLDVAGFRGRQETKFLPAVAGREASNYVDEVTRGGLWYDLLKQGYTPEAARDVVAKTHFDYGRMAPFERDYMRRLFPFYTWSRNVIPQQVGHLANYPGGVSGQAIRFGDAFKDQGFLPPYLGGALGVPVGSEEDGRQRFLTTFDLPWEQPFNQFYFGPGGLSQTAMRILGQANPLLKAPLELATNRQFYSGRELTDLYPLTGSTLVDNLVYNSPLARVATTGRQLADPRKWDPYALPLNLLTGVRVSDVDMEKQRTQAARDVIRQYLAGDPNVNTFQQFSVKPDAWGRLTPEELAVLRLNRTIEADAVRAAAARRKGVGG